jgi:hypothetical protein
MIWNKLAFHIWTCITHLNNTSSSHFSASPYNCLFWEVRLHCNLVKDPTDLLQESCWPCGLPLSSAWWWVVRTETIRKRSSIIFWDITLCSLVKFYCCGRIYRHHLQGGTVSQTRNQYEAGSKYSVLHPGFFKVGVAVRFSVEARDFSLLHSVQTASGAHPACYSMGTGGCFPWGKAAGAWSWPLTSISNTNAHRGD